MRVTHNRRPDATVIVGSLIRPRYGTFVAHGLTATGTPRQFGAAFPGKTGAVKNRSGPDATRRTVLIAGAANIVVGIVKLAAGILTGSSAMLAEAAHSAADTLDQSFLYLSLGQAERPASHDHPFGHGQERYFWSLLAAFGIFIAGAGFSVFEGILSMTRSQHEDPVFAYVALVIAFLVEGTSFARAFWQVRAEARQGHEGLRHHIDSSPDLTVKVALFEDSAAVVGLVIAALGVGLQQLTGSPVWDGGASIAIGALLVVLAVKLGMDSKSLLIGRAASPEVERLIREEIESRPGIAALLDLRTMHMGPDSIIVAARVALADEIDADETEDLADAIDRTLSERLALTPHVFIDPTQSGKAPSSAASTPLDQG
jgi:cation diffusion facilitator family transporter